MDISLFYIIFQASLINQVFEDEWELLYIVFTCTHLCSTSSNSDLRIINLYESCQIWPISRLAQLSHSMIDLGLTPMFLRVVTMWNFSGFVSSPSHSPETCIKVHRRLWRAPRCESWERMVPCDGLVTCSGCIRTHHPMCTPADPDNTI